LTTALPTSSRQYGGDNDFALMREFLSAASGLYESVGFRTVDRECLYGRKL
jgi:hypothetical protein